MPTPTLSVKALRASDVCDFLVAQGLAVALTATFNPQHRPTAIPRNAWGENLPPLPKRLYGVTPTGGPGIDTEEAAIDRQTFQIRSRGGQGIGDTGRLTAATDAEQIAWELDGFLLSGIAPGLMGSKNVRAVDRQGSPPAFFRRVGSAVEWNANYQFWVARTA